MTQIVVRSPPALHPLPSPQLTTPPMKPSETLSLLTRLSQKPGVQSTLVLARDTGAIVHTSGFLSNSAAANPNTTLPAPADNAANTANNAVAPGVAAAAAALTNGKQETGMRSAEDVARMVHGFVEAAGELVKNLEEEDEVKLLRLRTKKNELVIVPGRSRERSGVALDGGGKLHTRANGDAPLQTPDS
ncbi:dynein light chain-related protein [Diplodia corticola]|uniref:Dynein light chain-related protein n=1 Tax=Diplodia corticola TaxID=236234 RepID=A0A1J9R1E9_9PEZI|nr:dynein light chain-related protein [Diplodia corticola]OJD35214.1 dynein light chain-related protein [Diplodia corticola]